MTKRRNVLIGVGGMVAIAGCSDTSEPEPESDNEPEEEEELELEEEQEEEEPEEEEEEEPEEEEEEEEEQEPTQQELFEESLEEAEEQFRLALSEYGKSTDREDATILDVYPSTEIEQHEARDYLGEATDILWGETRDLAPTEEDAEMVSEYRTYDDFIIDLARTQSRIFRAYTVITPVEEGSPAYDRGQLDEAIEIHDELAEEVEDNEMYMEELTTKFEQLEWQIEVMEDMFNGLENVEGAAEFILVGETALNLAREDFDSAVEELEDTESAPPEDMTDEDLLELAEGYYEAADEALREITQSSDD